MKTRWWNKNLYSAVCVIAIILFSFSSAGSSRALAKASFLTGGTKPEMNVRPTSVVTSGNKRGHNAQQSSETLAALPPGTTLFPTTLVQVVNTSNVAWSPSSPDPSGVDYWASIGRLLIVDSEVEEMPNYFMGKNVFQSTTSGTLTNTCTTTTTFSQEPSGVAVNLNNNHIFFSDDTGNDKIFEVSLGADGVYCTQDDTFTTTNVATLYGVADAEDVSYGNNTVFIASGTEAEVYEIPLGANGILGGADDGPVTHFDTAALGFQDLEGIEYNADSGTLFILSTYSADRYLGEATISGTLLRAYDLSFMGAANNIRSGVAYAPGSQNPAIKSIYIVSRGLDNNVNPDENDGKIWEVNLGIPWVISITAASPNPTSAASVNYTVTFSEAVTGVDASDFTLSTTGISGAAIGGLTGSGSTYTVTVSTGSGSGSLRLDVTDNDSITDSAGLKLGGTGAGNGNFTTGASYTVSKTPAAAILTSPQSNIGPNFIPAYTWNVAQGATWYYLWINGPDGKTVFNRWYRSVDVCSGAACSVTPPVSLLSAGGYKWWVQTWNDFGYGPWSSEMLFSTTAPAPPGQASLAAPTGSIGDTTPTYTWNKLSGATWYYLWVNNSAGTPLVQKWYDAAEVCGASTCSVTPATLLGPGSYSFAVQTWNPGGYGPWSSTLSFSLALPNAATLVSPAGAITNTRPTYTWNQVSNAAWYYLWVNGPSGNVIRQWYEASAVCSGGACSVTPPITLTSGTHTWWVQTWNDNGYGPWSGRMDFSLP